MTNPSIVTRAAADIGGTFTDVAVLTPDGRLATRKLPSTPDNYADAVITGVRDLLAELTSPLDALEELLHGCTVATNAILEGKGAPTALLTTQGFRDVLELRRGAGPEPLRTPLRTPAAARAATASIRDRRADGAPRRGPPQSRREGGSCRGRAHPRRRHRVGRGLLPALVCQPRSRTAHRRDPARDASRRLRLAVGRRAAPEARVRAHLHDGHQRLRRTAGEALRAVHGLPGPARRHRRGA